MFTEAQYLKMGVSQAQMDAERAKHAPWLGRKRNDAWIMRESGGKPNETSYQGAGGLTQVMPATWGELQRKYPAAGLKDRYDPLQNYRAGLLYLNDSHDYYGGDLVNTFSGYHGGIGSDGTAHWGQKTKGYGGDLGGSSWDEEGGVAQYDVAPQPIAEYSGDVMNDPTDPLAGVLESINAPSQQAGVANQNMQQPSVFASMLAGIGGTPRTPYSGGLQSIAAGMGTGLQNYQVQMAKYRQNMGAGKYGNQPIPYEGRDADGNPVLRMGRMAPDGSMVDVPMPAGGQYIKPDTIINAGDAFYRTNPYRQGGGTEMVRQRELSPDQRPETMAAQEKAKGDAQFMLSERQAYIPTMNRLSESDDKTTNFVNGIDEVIDTASNWSTGKMSLLSFIPATDSFALSSKLKFIAGQVSMYSLLELKERGGTLGALSQTELDMLKASMGAMEQGLSAEEFKKELTKVRGVFIQSNARSHSNANRRFKFREGEGDYTRSNPRDFTKGSYDLKGTPDSGREPWVFDGVPTKVPDKTFESWTDDAKSRYIDAMIDAGIEL